MKGLRCIFLLLCLVLLSGCTADSGLTGTWEAEIRISVLGPEKQEERSGVTRFVFCPDGTGSWSTEISGGDYPQAVREFRYTQDGDVLTLTYGEGAADTEFTMLLTGDSLKLESGRGTFDLIRKK